MEINVLSSFDIDLIAAGEVVDYPVSVLKELLDNSLDAGATEIAVVLKAGGRELISVSDNGSGIPFSEVPKAFLRHATSKIQKFEDLKALYTRGFRGEALAAVASVSEIELKTRFKGEKEGSYYSISGGTPLFHKKILFNEGASFLVKNLFFNTPVRKNFLKSIEADKKAARRLLYEYALSHSDKAFFLSLDEKSFSFLKKEGSFEQRVEEKLKELYPEIHFCYKSFSREGSIVCSLWLAGEKSALSSKAAQHIFINERAVEFPALSKIIYEAVGPLFPAKKYAPYVLFIEIPPEKVDYNVHPQKKQVRIENQNGLLNLLHRTLIGALSFESDALFTEKTRVKEEEHHITQGWNLYSHTIPSYEEAPLIQSTQEQETLFKDHVFPDVISLVGEFALCLSDSLPLWKTFLEENVCVVHLPAIQKALLGRAEDILLTPAEPLLSPIELIFDEVLLDTLEDLNSPLFSYLKAERKGRTRLNLYAVPKVVSINQISFLIESVLKEEPLKKVFITPKKGAHFSLKNARELIALLYKKKGTDFPKEFIIPLRAETLSKEFISK